MLHLNDRVIHWLQGSYSNFCDWFLWQNVSESLTACFTLWLILLLETHLQFLCLSRRFGTGWRITQMSSPCSTSDHRQTWQVRMGWNLLVWMFCFGLIVNRQHLIGGDMKLGGNLSVFYWLAFDSCCHQSVYLLFVCVFRSSREVVWPGGQLCGERQKKGSCVATADHPPHPLSWDYPHHL